MNKHVVVLGSQWGDEGKGKIVDLLTEQVDAVVRFQGGHNAGHTLVIGNTKIVIRLLPSGVMRDGVQCFIGNGVVVSLVDLLQEIASLEAIGVTVAERLWISAACPLILPSHVALDEAHEISRGKDRIGTTGRGIGPAYEGKASRRAIRLGDILDAQHFTKKLQQTLEYHNFLLTDYYHQLPLDKEAIQDQMLGLAVSVKPYITDVAGRLATLREQDKCILFEGAQGTLLDIDHGTYPFVTASNTTAGAAATGSGFGPLYLDYVLGISKAYVTRVGSGPFPTELFDDIGTTLAERGHEFGSVTGRPRRCGWLDIVALKRAIAINSISGLCLTKIDVLDGLELIKLCVAYELDGEVIDYLPSDAGDVTRCTPVYETMPGWQTSTVGIKKKEALPQAALNYIAHIEALVKLPIDIISTGPERTETIVLHNPFID